MLTDAADPAGFQASTTQGPGKRSGVTFGSRRGQAEIIRYSIADSPLGRMLVAAMAQGVCNIAFADTDDALLRELRQRFAASDLQQDADALGEQVQAVLACLNKPALAVYLPLHVRSTAFQDRVWKALQAIPRGETRTYAQVAQSIGQPAAVRAVARACATNPVAVVVPCHRVLGNGGALTGYRWGLERKRKLLDLERPN